jgi:hypothetical protein
MGIRSLLSNILLRERVQQYKHRIAKSGKFCREISLIPPNYAILRPDWTRICNKVCFICLFAGALLFPPIFTFYGSFEVKSSENRISYEIGKLMVLWNENCINYAKDKSTKNSNFEDKPISPVKLYDI